VTTNISAVLCSHLCLRLNIAYCTLCTVYCVAGQRGKTINFHTYRTPRDQREGSTDPFRGCLGTCLPQTSALQLPHAIYNVQMQTQLIVI